MKIVAAGLNHKSAPIDIREKLAFDLNQNIDALGKLKLSYPEVEFVLLSTCNRVELYSVSEHTEGIDIEQIAGFFAEFHKVELNDFRDYLYVHTNEDAVRHLLTVASGLDSMVLGEDQILGQVKESYRLACNAKSTGKVLNRLFHCAFATSKKVHTNTHVSDGRISIAGVAVELAIQLFKDISKAKTVVIGAGEMGELLVKHLSHAGCSDITIVNRSYNRGKNIAERRGIKANKWNELNNLLVEADIVIASASTQDYLFKKSSFQKIMNNRQKKPLLIIDIAVPRDFEPEIDTIENVHLYSVDELSEVAKKNRKARESDISKGMQIIYESVHEFMDWFGTREVGPMIGKMKEQFGQISQKELERFFVGTRQEAVCKEVLEAMVNRVVSKLLHCVISNVDTVTKKHGPTEAAKLVDSIVRQAEKISSEHDDKGDKNT